MVEKNDQTIKLLHYVGLSGPGWPTFEKSYIKKVKIIFLIFRTAGHILVKFLTLVCMVICMNGDGMNGDMLT